MFDNRLSIAALPLLIGHFYFYILSRCQFIFLRATVFGIFNTQYISEKIHLTFINLEKEFRAWLKSSLLENFTKSKKITILLSSAIKRFELPMLKSTSNQTQLIKKIIASGFFRLRARSGYFYVLSCYFTPANSARFDNH